jgi:hypothetical protein
VCAARGKFFLPLLLLLMKLLSNVCVYYYLDV